MANTDTESSDSMRIDKWLWCARFYKTRALAVEAIGKNHVKVNHASTKPAKEIRIGDTIELQQANVPKTVVVQAMARTRGPAPIAQQLYQETPESLEARTTMAEQKRLAPEPADALRTGRPTKRDRRSLQELRDWDTRWSAQ